MEELLQNGFTLIHGAISPNEAISLRALYDDDALFRSRIVMERHSFGKGEYKYFANPLPESIHTLREGLYEKLVPVANEWMRQVRAHDGVSSDAAGLLASLPRRRAEPSDRAAPAIRKGRLQSSPSGFSTDPSRSRCKRRSI